MNSTFEIFRHTIQLLVADIDGVVDLADDVVIFETTQKLHDKALERGLERFLESKAQYTLI